MTKYIALVLVLCAQSLAAQTAVLVRSGEHEGFTRLTLQIDPAVEWAVRESRGQAAISFPGQLLSFDTDAVFRRISTERISGLRADNNNGETSLILELACQCEVKSFSFGGNYIVLDVFDGLALAPLISQPSTQWQPDALPFIQLPAVTRRFAAFVMDAAPRQPVLALDRSKAEPEDRGLPAPIPPLPVPNSSMEKEVMTGAIEDNTNLGVSVAADSEMRARLEAAQSQLLTQITRAVDQGLVEFVLAPVEVAGAPEVKKTTPAADPLVDAPPMEPDSELLQQLSARTAYAQNTEEALAEIVNQFAMPQCLDDEAFLMETWGDQSSFSDQLSSLRVALLGEFDLPNENVAEKIIQLYLRYGLGAEARMMIESTGNKSKKYNIYRDMSELLNEKPELVLGPIVQGAGCGGAHEMWALAAGVGNYEVMDPLLITDVFSSYPIEVRTLIGPPLAQAFIDRGQVEVGHVVLEIVRRADGEITAAQQMAEAKVLENQMNMAGAEKLYRDIISSRDALAPDAMIALASSILAAGRAPPETLLLDLESSAFFNRNTPRADLLKLWEIKVRATVEGPESALAQIVENLDGNPDIATDLQNIVTEIFERTGAEDIGDYSYAQMVLRYANILETGIVADAARMRIAQEMATIGLPETALDILAPNLSRPTPETRQFVAATYVQLFQPDEALEVLADDDSAAAYKTRIEAYLQKEDYVAVAVLLESDYSSQILLDDIALRAGDWEKIQASGAVGTLASFMNGEKEAMPGTPITTPEDGFLTPLSTQEKPSLKAVRDLLEVNRASRGFLENVLAEGQP
ncbi:MAG: hypothetical protein L3J37_09130 [Rhodobacteraceae bacterium]|nr:hypothetical protein [Paracoccaceae bacterium]